MTATQRTTISTLRNPPEPLTLLLRKASARQGSDKSDGENWNIDAIVFGDNSIGKNGTKIAVGTFYGSAKITGGHENYHAIDPFSFEFHTFVNRSISFSTRLIGSRKTEFPQQCVVPIAKETRQKQKSRGTVITEAVLQFCKKYPGVAVIIGGPGSRDSCKELEDYHVKKEDCIFAVSSELDCVPASIVNGIGAFRGPKAAAIAKTKLLSSQKHFLRLGQAGPFLHKLDMKCTIRRPGKRHRQYIRKGRYDAGFNWLANKDQGIWIVRLCKPNAVDHCFVVDGGRGLIIDSEESYPITLSPRTLRLCGGGSTRKLHIAELFEVTDA